MENLTLEQELVARIFMHKTAVLGGVLMKEYIDKQTVGMVNLPTFIIEEQADKHSNTVMRTALKEGTFDSMYNDAWDKIVDTMPEHLKVI